MSKKKWPIDRITISATFPCGPNKKGEFGWTGRIYRYYGQDEAHLIRMEDLLTCGHIHVTKESGVAVQCIQNKLRRILESLCP